MQLSAIHLVREQSHINILRLMMGIDGVRAGAKRLGRKNPLKFGIPPSEVENPM